MDKHYLTVKTLIESKEIQDFGSIFKHIPYTVVARDCGITVERLKDWIANPEKMQVGLVLTLSEMLEYDFISLSNMLIKSSAVLQSMLKESPKRK